MKLETEVSVEVEEDVEYFPLFSIESHEKGTRIKATSPTFAAYFSALPALEDVKGGGIWKGAVFQISGKPSGLPMSHGASLFVSDGSSPNLIWLTMKELKEGLDIIVPEPLSPNNLEDYFTATCDLLRDFYLTHIRKVKLQASLKYKGKRKGLNSVEAAQPRF